MRPLYSSPFTLASSLVLAAIFALLYSGKITKPLSDISKTTERMRKLDKWAMCKVETRDEIGVLSENINTLYRSLLTTIEDIRKESARVARRIWPISLSRFTGLIMAVTGQRGETG